MISEGFKYVKPVSSDRNAILDSRYTNSRRSGHNRREICEFSEKQAKQTTVFFSWLADYGQHSVKIGRVVYESWGKQSLFAFYEYRNGRLIKNEPSEPHTQYSALARKHLIRGYGQTWDFYQKGRAESLQTCREIDSIIRLFEQKIDAEISNEIVREENITEIPAKWDSQSHYNYHKVYDEIFKAGLYRTKQRELWIKSVSNFTYLVAGSRLNPDEILAYGVLQDMEALQKRILSLQENPEIMTFITNYNSKVEELTSNENKAKYFREIERIWQSINENGGLLKGHGACETLPECAVPP